MPALVHGMADDLVLPRWPPITDDEVRSVLRNYVPESGKGSTRHVTWRSPRPMSASVLVLLGDTSVFVKRHHVSVRSPERLRIEHDFSNHLLRRECPLPPVLCALDGDTVFQQGEFLYEVHLQAVGEDLYRDAPSWYPYATRAHARAAGSALARFHSSSHDYAAPMTPPGILTNTTSLIASLDSVVALDELLSARPGLRRALRTYKVQEDVDNFLRPALERAAAQLANCTSQWGHGDWHASNLMWSSKSPNARVASVIDLGLSNRTFAVHDLAIALERSCIDWLDIAGAGHISAHLDAVDDFLGGYEEQHPLAEHEWDALIAVLPVVHTEFALSEVEYFDQVAGQESNVHLAYDGYLIGHARWFETPFGLRLQDHLRRRASSQS